MTKMKKRNSFIVTGVGSRDTPKPHLERAYRIFEQIAKHVITRSSYADGMDKACMEGAKAGGGLRHMYNPYEGYKGYQSGCFGKLVVRVPDIKKSFECLKKVPHLNPYIFNQSAPQWFTELHARNYNQIHGITGVFPSDFMIFYAKPIGSRCVSGGTNTAYQVATHAGIPTYNLYTEHQYRELARLLKDKFGVTV